ncbi:anthranilate phosphoribosyltransferase (plasmid) [Legionella adelaidensis]|uniref:Anthranilate phosphoribosyltransferase n=1 Tax=Legionella adelaidensis TaxID=45056 RepID=A0A0W0R3U9_9GAMM|nr:anthranilate phosphoribosyltransferase [Legionella adelaidensis]KTC65723.1 anthranilate phosphoribosyltransferase [Legionella adelaidensis]VEH85111.1 anthranilate phosphoribosyltransferase [Legionella adelaidensis]
MKEVFEKLLTKNNLTSVEMSTVMQSCMEGKLTDVQIGAFLALMRMKGESVEELAAAAKVMKANARCVDLGPSLIDIVGTGGDGKNTFNVSTISSFVVAASGAKVAKHGNLSVSSRSGSADFLLQAGFKLDLTDDQLKQCINYCGITFLFAPQFHPAMRFAKKARQELGVRTFFNLLGPLVNPAQARKQVIGVFSSKWQEPIAKVLGHLGSERACVIHSHDGLDEISIADKTSIYELNNGEVNQWTLDPRDYDCMHTSLEEIIVESPTQSLNIAKAVLNGEKGAARDIVLLNSALAIYCFNTHSFEEAFLLAQKALDGGEAFNRFQTLRDFSNEC